MYFIQTFVESGAEILISTLLKLWFGEKRIKPRLPNTIIDYISKNISSPKLYHKLIKCRKYFKQKNQKISLHCLVVGYDGLLTCSRIGEKSYTEINGKFCRDMGDKYYVLHLNLQNIYVHNYLNIQNTSLSSLNKINSPKLFHSFLGKFEACIQIISTNELMHIRASVKNCKFSSVTIKNDDGSNASLAEIIQCFPLLEKFEFTGESVSSHITATTVKELIKIPHFLNIKKFKLFHISEEFDIEEFYESFLKKNKTMDIELLFDENNSDAYNQRVETVMNKILLESKINDIWPPIIFYGTIINELTLKLYSAHKRASKYLKEFCYLWIFCFSAPCLGGLFGDIKNWYSNTFSSL